MATVLGRDFQASVYICTYGMSMPSLHTESTDSVIALMTLDVIAEMDVSDKSGNSIQLIEEFIDKEYPNDPQYARSTMASSPLRFPPGHWRKIEMFVKVSKLQKQSGRKSQKNNYGFSPKIQKDEIKWRHFLK